MSITRRTVLAGLGAVGVLPAWAQVIAPQSDPWAQIDPYADPRNGFAQPAPAGAALPGQAPKTALAAPRGGDSDNEEIAGALEVYQHFMEENGGPHPDQRVQQAIAEFITPLARVSDRPYLPWEAHVTRDETVNAWTVGGGKLSFNAGLVAMCDHPGELAAVVAHEMGHVDKRHAVRSTELGQLLAQANAAQMGGLGKISAGALAPGPNPQKMKTAFDLLRAGYKRTNEFEADEHSLVILSRAGIAPQWALSMMSKLQRLGFEHGHHLLNDLALDHPNAGERLENMKRAMVFQPKSADTFTPPGWQALKAALPTPAKWRNA